LIPVSFISVPNQTFSLKNHLSPFIYLFVRLTDAVIQARDAVLSGLNTYKKKSPLTQMD